MKRLLCSLVVLFVLFSAFASYRTELGVEYTYSLSDNAHLGSLRTDFIWSEGGLDYGALLTVGYGVQHYREGGSSALIYGPGITAGPQVRYDFGSFETSLDVRAAVAYALFPVILRGEADFDVLYKVTSGLKISLGYGYFFDIAEDTYRGDYNAKASSVHVVFGVIL